MRSSVKALYKVDLDAKLDALLHTDKAGRLIQVYSTLLRLGPCIRDVIAREIKMNEHLVSSATGDLRQGGYIVALEACDRSPKKRWCHIHSIVPGFNKAKSDPRLTSLFEALERADKSYEDALQDLRDSKKAMFEAIRDIHTQLICNSGACDLEDLLVKSGHISVEFANELREKAKAFRNRNAEEVDETKGNSEIDNESDDDDEELNR